MGAESDAMAVMGCPFDMLSDFVFNLLCFYTTTDISMIS